MSQNVKYKKDQDEEGVWVIIICAVMLLLIYIIGGWVIDFIKSGYFLW